QCILVPELLTRWAAVAGTFDMRLTEPLGESGRPIVHPFWIRHAAPLPDDPALHACVLAFVSDMAVVISTVAPHRRHLPRAGASLDHALWFHRRVRADEWMLFSVTPVSNAGARGLGLGTMHTTAGVHVASIAQEALLRVSS